MDRTKSSTIKLSLSSEEKKALRNQKLRIRDVANYPPEALVELMNISKERAKELAALCEFQLIPSIGIRFAEDLISMNIYTLKELEGQDPVQLIDRYESQLGYWVDPCVEDQFRLAVYFAETQDDSKTWWDFTAERKKYRAQQGYTSSRPTTGWHELR